MSDLQRLRYILARLLLLAGGALAIQLEVAPERIDLSVSTVLVGSGLVFLASALLAFAPLTEPRVHAIFVLGVTSAFATLAQVGVTNNFDVSYCLGALLTVFAGQLSMPHPRAATGFASLVIICTFPVFAASGVDAGYPKPAFILGVYSITAIGWYLVRTRLATLASLERSRARLFTIMNASMDAIVACDDHGRITDWSSQAEAIFGHSREMALGQSLAELIVPAASRDRHRAGFRRAMTSPSQGPVQRVRVDALKADGTTFPAELSFSRITASDTVMAVAFVRDITHELEADRRLEGERARSAHSAKLVSMGEMAGGVAHEINNPLTIVQGHAQRLERLVKTNKLDSSIVARSVQEILAASDRITRIVRSLRIYSRAADSDPYLPVSIQSVVDNAMSLLRKSLEVSGIAVSVTVEEPDTTFHCRESEVLQVLLNLMTNARDAIEPLSTKWLRLNVTTSPSSITFTVVDSGSGIPQNLQARIMDPFFTTKPVGKGTGLGLGISRKIAQSHGGDLILDVGATHTTFVFRVARDPRPLQERAA